MKIRFVIICFVVLALFACYNKHGNWRQAKAFRTVRKKMKNNPSEALALLESDSMLDLKAEDIAYYSEYQLLKAEAYYLNDCWKDDVDFQTSANYYDSISNLYPRNDKLSYQKAKLYYYFGIYEFENGNYQEAVSNFLQALESCESKALKRQIYNELDKCFAYVFYNNELIDEEQIRKKTLNYYVLSAVFVFVVASLYISIRYRKRKDNEIDLIRKSIESHKNYIEKARSKGGGISFAARLNDFENCEICISLKERLSKRNVSRKTITDCYDCALDNRENSFLSNNANHCFPDFSTLLVEDLGVKGDNITYCCLCLLGFSIIEIAVLMKISYQAAHKRLVLIKETLKTESDIREFLMGYFGDVYC